MKPCTEECKYCNHYNEDWVECYHPDYAGSRKPFSMPCLLDIDPKTAKEDTANDKCRSNI